MTVYCHEHMQTLVSNPPSSRSSTLSEPRSKTRSVLVSILDSSRPSPRPQLSFSRSRTLTCPQVPQALSLKPRHYPIRNRAHPLGPKHPFGFKLIVQPSRLLSRLSNNTNSRTIPTLKQYRPSGQYSKMASCYYSPSSLDIYIETNSSS